MTQGPQSEDKKQPLGGTLPGEDAVTRVRERRKAEKSAAQNTRTTIRRSDAPPETPSPVFSPEDTDGNVTIYQTENFFVHAVLETPLAPDARPSAAHDSSLLTQFRWMATQQQRFSLAETRLLPRIELFNPVRKKELPVPVWVEAFVVTLALVIVACMHLLDMFNYPSYSPEEGSYVSNAWALGHGMLEPYAYLYNQPPLGWMQLAVWTQISNLLLHLNSAMQSARLSMLFYAVGSALLVYLIGQRIGASRGAGLLALFLCALSPLGITYQRMVLLENISTFWLLLSLYLLVASNSHLRNIVFAGIALGMAVLSKEVMLIFFPVFFYGVWLHSTRFQRKFAVVAFTYIVLSLCSAFVLLAVLKGELFPHFYNHNTQLPSLLGALQANLHPTTSDNLFKNSWDAWQHDSLPLHVLSAGAIVINVLFGNRNRVQWFLAFLLLSFWAYLLLSGLAYPSYIVIELPLMALNIAVALNEPLHWVCRRVGFDLCRALLIFALIGALVPFNIQQSLDVLSLHAATAQEQALAWVRANIPTRSVVIINSYLFADLHQTSNDSSGQPVADPDVDVYNYAFVYGNAVSDPNIRDVCLHDDWNMIDYLVVDSHMLHDIRSMGSQMLILDRALSNSTLVQVYTADNDPQNTIRIYKVTHNSRMGGVSCSPS